ncbi:MAG: CoA pyrophosphatase [Rhodospirillales bacterium]|nr:CoA pyrophosphatase [Rhodospirillales bacterium]
MSESEIRAAFARAAPHGVRGALAAENGGERGDHDLNPGLSLPSTLRDAAVLVPIVTRDDPTLLLTLRNSSLAAHAGQISFPGGRIEASDDDAVAAALRESREEIGLDPAAVEPIGRLDRYVTRTGYAVTPIVALVHPPFDLVLDPGEVEDAFEVPLSWILEPSNRQLHGADYQGVTRHFYVYPYGERRIWGATAGMLANLVEVLTA